MKKTVTVSEFTMTTVEYSEDDIIQLILKDSGLTDGGIVELDVSMQGILRGATVRRTTNTVKEDPIHV